MAFAGPLVAAVSPSEATAFHSGMSECGLLVDEDAIEKNEPETGLDRLHTFTVKVVRWSDPSEAHSGDSGSIGASSSDP